MPNRLLVIGASSRVGSHLATHPPRGWKAESAGRTDPRTLGVTVEAHHPLDLQSEPEVRAFLRSTPCDAWVNFAARTDVDGCEKERPASGSVPAGPKVPGSAWQVNAELPRWIAEEAERAGRFFVQVSTDHIFDGRRGPYPEATPPSPFGPQVNWYGYTKGVGEAAVYASKGPRSIVRISYPFGTELPGRSDLALNLLAQRRAGKVHPLYTDQRFSPTWIPDVSEALDRVIERSSPKIYHVASPEVTAPFEFAQVLLSAAGWPVADLAPSRLAALNPAPGRAPRPLLGGLLVTDIHKLDIRPRSFREGIRALMERSSLAADHETRATVSASG